MRRFLYSSATLAFLFLSGCASFSTIPITRHDSDVVSGDSNGLTRWCSRSRPFKGIPVKLKVLTHVDVWIDEEYLLVKGEKYETWREKPLEHRLFSVRTSPVYSDQVVICDFKRPASGTIDLEMDFTDEQYFDKITSDITDTTIKDSAALLSTIITKTAAPGGVKAFATEPSGLSWQTRTVAFQRFDVSAVDYEQQVECFVNHHLNNCNQCSGFPSYDVQPVAIAQ